MCVFRHECCRKFDRKWVQTDINSRFLSCAHWVLWQHLLKSSNNYYKISSRLKGDLDFGFSKEPSKKFLTTRPRLLGDSDSHWWNNMIQLLFTLVFVERALALFLMVNIPPLRNLIIKILDQVKIGNDSTMVKTLGGTMLVILASSITSILKIQTRSVKMGTITPTGHIPMQTHLLEALLMGIFVFPFLDHPFFTLPSYWK